MLWSQTWATMPGSTGPFCKRTLGKASIYLLLNRFWCTQFGVCGLVKAPSASYQERKQESSRNTSFIPADQRGTFWFRRSRVEPQTLFETLWVSLLPSQPLELLMLPGFTASGRTILKAARNWSFIFYSTTPSLAWLCTLVSPNPFSPTS